MIYILDFDRTLFDTPAYYSKVSKLGLDEIIFNPEIWKEINACEFLYSDVLDWVATKSKEDLFILTAINPSYGDGSGNHQKAKLACSQVAEIVKEVIFVEGLKGEYVVEIAKQFPPSEKIVFVDDTLEQCLSVKESLPNAVCCLMIRDKSVVDDTGSIQGIEVVSCLSEVDDTIKSVCG